MSLRNTKDEEEFRKSLLADKGIDEQFTNQGASVMNATANIIKSGIGTGLLFMPYVFSQCGIVLSIVFMGAMGIVAFYCWSQLCKIIRVLEQNGLTYDNQTQLTLETATGLILGNKSKNFSIIVTLIFIYGSSVGYCIFILQTMQEYIPNQLITLAIIFVIYMPLSMFRQIEKLGLFSQFALIALTFSIIVIIVYSSYEVSQHDFSGFSVKIFDIKSLPLYFGVFAFSYDINGVVTEVHASMKEKQKFDRVLFAFIFFSFVLGSILGVLGYFAFREDVNSVVFRNFTHIGAFSTVISSLFSLSVVASILLYGFPIVKTIDRLTSRSQPKPNIFTMILTRVIFFLSISLQGIYVQSITNVFNLLGSVFSVILTFILPMILLEKMKYNEKKGIKIESKFTLTAENENQNVDNENQQTPNINKKQKDNTENETIQDTTQQNSVSDYVEKLPKGAFNSILNIAVVIVGIIGGVSGLVSSIIDLS